MKRTGEFVLSIIAGAINLFLIVSGVRSVSADPSVLRQQLSAAGTHLTAQDINSVIQLLNTIGTLLITLSIVSILLAVIALILLKRNSDKPKLAGWLLILAGVVSLIEIIPGILYIIAGIMALVRKPMFE
ncbi:DUF4064 domain-containing protein [Sporolactobacillus putidus]|uniref:DUF4064 domain-containing protein n=1 Tax=Sporolactobacillus putidus TaxID=492735 RepID=A0A917S950_9BACL|nr:DUF4064 domain-containing protein [Sporolactobacillus putidus]GGL65148.1 hypothetical protein GCM10007968_31440 [Sporolactobacillus putidus]